MTKKVTNKASSLFDRLYTEVENELSQFQSPYSKIPEDGLVYYLDSRTGRETYTSAGRWYAITSLLPGLRKRYIGATNENVASPQERERLAIQEFLEDNERCAVFNKEYDPSLMDGFVAEIRGMVIDLVDKHLGCDNNYPSVGKLARFLRSGPGKSSGIPGEFQLSAGSYTRMGNSPMSFSSAKVKRMYKTFTSLTPLTFAAEAVRLRTYGELDSVDTPALFLSVPKTNKKNRGICEQPSGNMTLQLATHEWLVGVLKTWGIDLQNQQELNRDLAQYGSRGTLHCRSRTWSFHTWDLSRASNFPWIIIRDLFPPYLVGFLDDIRSHVMEIPMDKNLGGPLRVRKSMCSTMGNGFTFALMTYLLSAVVKSLYAYFGLPEYDYVTVPCKGSSNPEGIRSERIKTWGVYGDDIIVDARLRFALPRVLRAFGFLVNHSKSCTTGLFRESCGGDFYDGYNVRPVFVETLDSQADIYSLCNRLMAWSINHSVPLPRSIHILRQAASKEESELRVPNHEDVSAGLHVPPSMRYPTPKGELALVNYQGGYVYTALIPKPSRLWIYREIMRKRWYTDIITRERKYFEDVIEVKWNVSHQNEYAITLHTLSGEIRKGQLGYRRPGAVKYTKEKRFTPSWGTPLTQGVTAFGLRTEYAARALEYWNTNALILLTKSQRKAAE